MPSPAPSLTRTVLLTVLTLVAFAGNSILARMALRTGSIDPATFTALRLVSGALMLLPFLGGRPRPFAPRAAVALFVYALAFSFAYVELDAGTGALVLFGLVQVTMIGAGWRAGERLGARRWLGVLAAVVGVVWLVLPDPTAVAAPQPWSAVLMATAGVAWGLYSLLGRGATRPSASTAANFVLAAPLAAAAALLLAFLGDAPLSLPSLTSQGALLAIASGAITSGLGYVLWYATLPGHSATSAAVVQLTVPVIAALGGVVLLGETLTPRLVGAGALTLSGVAIAVFSRSQASAGRER